MNFTFLHDLLSSPWHLEPNTFNSVYPIFNGILNGMSFDKAEEPQSNKPYMINNGTEEQNGNLVHILPINGILTKHDQYCGSVGTRTLATRLKTADNNKDVSGHVLLIESGGGQSVAVPELAEAMAECNKPIIAYVDGMAASAAYYIASYADEIIASRNTDYIGCIGTMIEYRGRKKISAEDSNQEVSVRIYASNSEEKNEEYEEAINNQNIKLTQERILNPANEEFLKNVKANRPNVTKEHLKGRTFPASEVVGSLIDSIGNLDHAIERVLSLSDNKQTNIINKKMDNFKNLNSVLDVSTLEISNEGAYLTEVQLGLIEAALTSAESTATELKDLQETASAKETELNTANETINQQNQTIEELNSEIAELKENPGTTGATAVTTHDDNTAEQKTVATGENLADDIVNVQKTYMED